MSTEGLRLLILFAGILGAGGCAGVPPAPHAAARPPEADSTSGDPYDGDDSDGWLFNRLTGQTASDERPDAASGVVPASVTEPVAPSVPTPPVTVPVAGPSDENSGFQWSDLAPENVYKDLKEAAGYGPSEEISRALLEEGKRLQQQKQYAAAAGRFQSAAKRWPDSILEEDALFLLGESYFFDDRYPKAQDAYENLLKKYSNSRYLDTVGKRLFAIGQYWEKLHKADPHWPMTPNVTNKERPTFDTFGNALKAYETIRLNDPTGPLADDSIMATANAYFNKGRFEDAAFHYDILRKEYPKSEHQAKAHLLGMQAKLQVYQGARYDRTPLNEADEIADQALSQFSSELGTERQRLAATRDRIAEQQAERDWTMAQYYENRKAFGAARYYYQGLIKDYPLTQYARQAQARLEQIRDKPDNPPNRFQWLTDIFPAEGEGE